MKDKQIEQAIIKGIESKGAIDVGDEIAKSILSENAQNNEFIEAKTTDETPVCETQTIIDDVPTSNENGTNKQDNKQTFGKFKNPEELLKAYLELEKEFTKKSQKLKTLEASNDEQDFDEFFCETPSAKPFAKDIAIKIMEQPDLKRDKNCLSVALVKVLIDKFRTPEQLMQDGQFLKDYVLSSSKVKDAIINEYLQGLKDGQPPVTLSANGMQCVAPSKKIRSIEEAGRMFLKNNE